VTAKSRNVREREERFEITGDLDDQTVEVIRLEMRELARRYGVTITEFRLEKTAASPSRKGAAGD
jgi:ABC-type phosphate transport system auxiliary subunit